MGETEGTKSSEGPRTSWKAKDIPVEILGRPSEKVRHLSQLAVSLALAEENFQGQPPLLTVVEGFVFVQRKACPACYDWERPKTPIRVSEAGLPFLWHFSLRPYISHSISALFATAHETKHYIDDQRGQLDKTKGTIETARDPDRHYSSEGEQNAHLLACRVVNKAVGFEMLVPKEKGELDIYLSEDYLPDKDDQIYEEVIARFSEQFSD